VWDFYKANRLQAYKRIQANKPKQQQPLAHANLSILCITIYGTMEKSIAPVISHSFSHFQKYFETIT